MFSKSVFSLWFFFILIPGCHASTEVDPPETETEHESEPPVTDEKLIMMPLGDSLTNDSRPRVTLWNLLTDDGYKIHFAGDQKQESSIPDPYHEGVGGIKIQGIIDKTVHLMETHQPQFVLLMVGTNDIAWYFDETAQQIGNRWNELIQLIFDSSEPGTVIIAATIPPVTPKLVGKYDLPMRDRAVLVQHYNSELRYHISNRQERGERIFLADVEAEINPGKHLSNDGVHLNEEGYKIMGTVYYEGVITALSEI